MAKIATLWGNLPIGQSNVGNPPASAKIPKRERVFKVQPIPDQEGIMHWLASEVIYATEHGTKGQTKSMHQFCDPKVVFHRESDADRYCQEMVSGLAIEDCFL